MKKILLVISLALSSLASNYQLNLNKNITVSGISSGAFFAHQFHIAHSKLVSGAALFAGGPYYCANGSSNTALNTCMKAKASESLADSSFKRIKKEGRSKKIDKLSNLKRDRVFIFTGMTDSVVNPAVSFQLKRFYNLLGIDHNNLKFISDMIAGHTYPTLSFGNKCSEPKKSPFISNCNYDGAFNSLQHLYPHKKEIEVLKEGRTLKVDQSKYFSFGKLNLMQKEGSLYIPSYCDAGNKCDFHVAFHGCSQTVDHIDQLYVEKTGIKEAADRLGIVVLFPQAKKAELGGINPYGCWDWWGYSGKNYHTKQGAQIKIIEKMIHEIL